MIIAVTGASGFVGSHLIKKLRNAHIETRILAHDKLKKEDTNTFIGDIVTGKGLDKFLMGCDALINLVGRFQLPFFEQYKLNTLAVHTLCEAAVRQGVKKIIHLSAVAAYGSAKDMPFVESDVLHPDTSYGLSKKLGEEVIVYFSHALPYVILRPSNIYGPGNTQGVIHSFMTSYMKEGKIAVTGDGEQARDFIHVTDMVEAIYQTLMRDVSGQVFNISSGTAITLNTLAHMFERVVGHAIPIAYLPHEPERVRILAAKNTKAIASLHWKPTVSLPLGISELIKSSV